MSEKTLKETLAEIVTILFAALILAATVSHTRGLIVVASSFAIFIIIILINVVAKELAAYYYEANIKTKFWQWYQYGFRADSHFKEPLPMAWLPIALSLITKGFFWWMPILEFDITPRTERVSKRHELYRYTQMSEWHVGLIAFWGIVALILSSLIGYLFGFEYFTKLCSYYTLWNIIPLSNWDGTKILFGSRTLWVVTAIISLLFAFAAFII
jgi:hypothetical protein